MSLSHAVQETDQQNASLKPIILFLDTINAVPQKYGSFEKAEQAIRELVVELEESMVQETLSQYDIISALLANIYVHYSLDLWVTRKFAKTFTGIVWLIRYADDFVVCFQLANEAEVFRLAMEERLKQLRLEIAPEAGKGEGREG